MKDDTIPFDFTNPEHRKGLVNTLKKIKKLHDKTEPRYLVMDREDYRFIKKHAKSILNA